MSTTKQEIINTITRVCTCSVMIQSNIDILSYKKMSKYKKPTPLQDKYRKNKVTTVLMMASFEKLI